MEGYIYWSVFLQSENGRTPTVCESLYQMLPQVLLVKSTFLSRLSSLPEAFRSLTLHNLS